MAKPTSNSDQFSDCAPAGRVEPDFSGLDSAADMLRDAAKFGLLDDLRKLLGIENRYSGSDKLRIARDIAYEFAGEKDRDLAVDVFIHVTGIAEFGRVTEHVRSGIEPGKIRLHSARRSIIGELIGVGSRFRHHLDYSQGC